MKLRVPGVAGSMRSHSYHRFLSNPVRPGRARNGHCTRAQRQYAATIRRSRIRDRIYIAEAEPLPQ